MTGGWIKLPMWRSSSDACCGALDVSEIDILQINRLRRHNYLMGMSTSDGKRRSQRFMACDQSIQAALQSRAIYTPGNSPGHGHLINSRASLDVREEPQPLLPE